MAQLMYKIANEAPPDIRTYHADLSDRVATVVAHLLCKQPESHFQEGNLLAREIRLAIAELAAQSAIATANSDEFSVTQTMSRPSTMFNKTVVSELRNSGADS